MPMPPYPDANLTRDTIGVDYDDDPRHTGLRKTLETIILPEGYEWVQTGTRTRERRVKNRNTLFDGNGYLIMSYFGKWTNMV